MPTARPRHIITETDDIAAAIDHAEPLFPGASRAEILRRLVHAGAETVADARTRRTGVVRQHAGRHPGLYPDRHLDELREDWPG